MKFPFALQPKPSRRLRAALVFLHLAALASLVEATNAPMLLAGGAVAMALSLAWALSRRLPEQLLLLDDGSVRLIEGAMKERTGTLHDASTNFGWLTVLIIRFEEESSPLQHVVLLRDALSAEEHRRLQIWLRWIRPFRRASSNVREP